jgi:ionotropic glutamate receptor
MELFLATRCEFGIVGQEFTKMGWGFVSILPNSSSNQFSIFTSFSKLFSMPMQLLKT